MALTTPARSAATGADIVRRSLTGRRVDVGGTIFRVLLVGALVTTVGVLAFLLYDVVTGGWGTLSSRPLDFITGTMASSAETTGLAQGIRGTFFIGAFVVLIAFPVGIGAAVYLEEYAGQSRFSRFVDVNIRNLAGVPSVVYGLLGLAVFVGALQSITGPQSNGRTVISAGLTLAVLVLPIVIITAAEALRAVPNGIREAGFGVGATRSEVVRSHVLPYAAPGILTGTVLALSRALGEAAPLLLVGATSGFLTGGDSYQFGELQDRFAALPHLIASWAGRPGDGYREATAAAIVVLLVIVLLANTAAIVLRNRYEKKR